MSLHQENFSTWNFFRLHLNFWLLLFVVDFIPISVSCQNSGVFIFHKEISENEKKPEESNNKREHFLLSGHKIENLPKNNFKENYAVLRKLNNSCQYFEAESRLICTGSLDVPFIRSFRHKEINEFVVEKYVVESQYNNKFLDNTYLETGIWYLNLPKIFQKLTAEIILKGIGLDINVITSLKPIKNEWNSYSACGITFSNSAVKFSDNLAAKLSLDFVNNRTVVSIYAETVDAESAMTVLITLRFVRRDIFFGVDEWQAQGIVKSPYIENNQMGFFSGTAKTMLLKKECKFSGEVVWDSSSLTGSIYGKVSSMEDKQVTIPRGVFANMTIKNLIFTDSNFLNDFEEDTFEGLKKVESIAFFNSDMEMMPNLSEFFQYLPDLRKVYIESCTTPNLEFGNLPSLRNIRKISLQNSGPFRFDEFSFAWLKNSNLTHLNLAGTHISLASSTYSLLGCVRDTLKYLNISYSTIRDEKELTVILTSLQIKSLSAESLQLIKIPTSSLAQVKDTLEYLSLKGNHFKKVLEKNMFTNILQFPRMENLKKLNLENCNINYIEKGAFDNLPNLKILNLKFNELENLQEGWAFTKPIITHLDLSYNGLYRKLPLNNKKKETTLNLRIFKNLYELNLSNGIFLDVQNVISSLDKNLRVLFLRNLELKNLPFNIFQKLTNLKTLDLSSNKDLFPNFFFVELFQNLKNLKKLMLSNCRINGDWVNILKEENKKVDPDLTQLKNLTYLDLSYNYIRTFDFLYSNNFPNLKILNLSSNDIVTWKTSLFEYTKYLETLYLDENKIENMSEEMIADVWKLKNVKLGNNPFVCKSFVYEILKMANKTVVKQTGKQAMEKLKMGKLFMNYDNRINKSSIVVSVTKELSDLVKFVNIKDWSNSGYACFSCTEGKYIPFVQVNETCEEQNSFKKNTMKDIVVLWIPVTVLIGIVLSVVLVCQKLLGVHIISNAIKHAVALTFLNMEEKEPAKYNYNVFLSYSDADRQWVVDKLLPRLETLNNIKICLHERDFQVGLSILENIIACMDSSKNIILVLSQNFLKSHWCQYEMHLAQHRLLENGRDQLLLIFLENIPSIKKTKTLRYLMMTKTYLEWPAYSKNPNDYELFWNRLLKSLSLKFDKE